MPTCTRVGHPDGFEVMAARFLVGQSWGVAASLTLWCSCLTLCPQPTNHLDLEACVWLEDYLSKFKRILLMVSHR